MKETARYCQHCVAKLTPTETDLKKKEFFEAELLQEGSSPDYQVRMEPQGSCESCGKRGDVLYFSM